MTGLIAYSIAVIGIFLIVRSGKPQTIESSIVTNYEDYVIDTDGTLVYTNKHIDIKF